MTEEERIEAKQKGWIKLPLTHEDRVICTKIAQARNSEKEKKYGSMTYAGKRGKLGGAEAHYFGLLPEMGCCRRWGTDIDTRISNSHGYHDFDVILNDHRVEVKATSYIPPLLRVECEHNYKDIVSFFCTYVENVSMKDFTGDAYLVGWASAEKVFSQAPRRLSSNLPLNYILEESELKRFRSPLA